MGADEVLGNELELELVVESARDLDLSLLAFCRNFGSLDNECEVDGTGEEFDGEWRDLLEDIVSRTDYVLKRQEPRSVRQACRPIEACTYVHSRCGCRRGR